jgi:hypothetical protein
MVDVFKAINGFGLASFDNQVGLTRYDEVMLSEQKEDRHEKDVHSLVSNERKRCNESLCM